MNQAKCSKRQHQHKMNVCMLLAETEAHDGHSVDMMTSWYNGWQNSRQILWC